MSLPDDDDSAVLEGTMQAMQLGKVSRLTLQLESSKQRVSMLANSAMVRAAQRSANDRIARRPCKPSVPNAVGPPLAASFWQSCAGGWRSEVGEAAEDEAVCPWADAI